MATLLRTEPLHSDRSATDSKAPFTRIDHVQLAMPAGQEYEARRFYGEVPGLDEVAKPEALAQRGGAWFRSGGVTLHLVDADFRAAKKAHPAFRCTDYAELLAHLAERGVTIVADDIPFEGRAHYYIADPFGNRLELIAA